MPADCAEKAAAELQEIIATNSIPATPFNRKLEIVAS
jgi:hypothetical protein